MQNLREHVITRACCCSWFFREGKMWNLNVDLIIKYKKCPTRPTLMCSIGNIALIRQYGFYRGTDWREGFYGLMSVRYLDGNHFVDLSTLCRKTPLPFPAAENGSQSLHAIRFWILIVKKDKWQIMVFKNSLTTPWFLTRSPLKTINQPHSSVFRPIRNFF